VSISETGLLLASRSKPEKRGKQTNGNTRKFQFYSISKNQVMRVKQITAKTYIENS